MRMFTAHVLTRDGTWAHKQLRGPNTYAQWEASWDVFAAAMVMLGIASPGVLRQYASSIKRLDRLFPRDWATISTLDEEMRCEQWNRLRQEIMDGDENMPAGWRSDAPWASIISATRSNFLAGPRADWWREREILLERALSSKPLSSQGPRSGVISPAFPSAQGTAVIPELGGTTDDIRSSASADRNKAKKEKKRAKAQAKKTAWAPASSGGGGKATGKGIGPCHRCGKMGHLKRNCPLNDNASQESSQKKKKRKTQKGSTK